jgi:molybdopterin-guanine dinucleotide biosynthesis protein B
MHNAQIPLLGFAAASGTGKTTLLTQLIPLLKQRGLRIGLIKHSHHNVEIDQPGKDSYRLRAAGAEQVMLVSPHRRAIIREFIPVQVPRLDEQLAAFDQTGLDLILVEGFKSEVFPKIELHRAIVAKPLLYLEDDSIIAVASDVDLCLPDGVTKLDLNNPPLIVEFIVTRFVNGMMRG